MGLILDAFLTWKPPPTGQDEVSANARADMQAEEDARFITLVEALVKEKK